MSGEVLVRPGGSFVRFEPPDLCVGVFVGDVTPEDMTVMFAALKQFSHGKPHVFTLGDLSRCRPLSAATRKAAAEASKDLRVRASAVIGASLPMRMFATLLAKTVHFFNGITDDYTPVRFFATEAEARAWLAERREILAQELR